MAFNKNILILIFSLLVIVIAVEIGYLIFSPNQVKKSSPIVSNKSAIDNNQSQPQICFSPNDSKGGTLNESTIELLKEIKKDNLVSSTVINQYRGRILNIDTKGGFQDIDKSRYKNIQKDKYEYKIKFDIKGSEKENSLDFIFPASLMPKVEFTQKINNEEKPMNVQELKEDDLVSISEVINLTNKKCLPFNCVIKYKITRIIK